MALIKPIERRNSNRYHIELELDLVLENGSILAVTANDISEHGIQFSCDAWIANEIEPRGIHKHAQGNIQLKLVATTQSANKLYARCRVVSARRLSQDTYIIGLEFSDFESDTEKHLFEYLDSLA